MNWTPYTLIPEKGAITDWTNSQVYSTRIQKTEYLCKCNFTRATCSSTADIIGALPCGRGYQPFSNTAPLKKIKVFSIPYYSFVGKYTYRSDIRVACCGPPERFYVTLRGTRMVFPAQWYSLHISNYCYQN